jgi:4-diphosphocytidyl-2-C-methyl-D-erythritol kinase
MSVILPATPQENAHAKVNLFLHVTGRRNDGYHLLDSLAVFPDIADRLSVRPGPQLRLSLSGPFASGLDASGLQAEGGDNLVLRAARALAAEHVARGGDNSSGAHLTLEKHLPVASGIGGGSSDAAATLRLLRRFWSLEINDERLRGLAAGLGADVPVCLSQHPARMGGVGEILREAPSLPDLGMVLINCGEAVATAAVFRARESGFSPEAELPRGWSDTASLASSLALLSNDLEAAACHLCPTITAVLAALRALPGCLFARMSGSGATCFGLFDAPHAATVAAAEAAARGHLPAHWWVWTGGLRRS